MAALHIKKGDEVVVIAGTEKGKRGKIIEVSTRANRVIVEREGTLHASNVMRADRFDARAAKRGGAAAG
jgi:large subunit ribosomal protein L24